MEGLGDLKFEVMDQGGVFSKRGWVGRRQVGFILLEGQGRPEFWEEKVVPLTADEKRAEEGVLAVVVKVLTDEEEDLWNSEGVPAGVVVVVVACCARVLVVEWELMRLLWMQ